MCTPHPYPWSEADATDDVSYMVFAGQRRHTVRDCIWCGMTFEPETAGQLFCEDGCLDDYYR